MNIPEMFKKAIADTFYDKTVDIYETIEEIGEELDVIRKKGNIKQPNLSCNVHSIGNEVAQRDYGLNIEANIMITCSDTLAEIGDIIVYNNKNYIITGKLTPDSHIKLFANSGDKYE